MSRPMACITLGWARIRLAVAVGRLPLHFLEIESDKMTISGDIER